MKHPWRFWFIVFLLALAVCGIVWRMIDLMVVQRGFLLGQGDSRSLRLVTIPAYRGIITDRHGNPLAISVPVDDIWMDPKEFKPTGTAFTELSLVTKIPDTTLQNIYLDNSQREFAYIERGADPFVGEKIEALRIPGIYIKRVFRRYYPEGDVAAQLLGFTNIDDQGQSGIELEFNRWLQGAPGKKEVLVDRLGDVVSDVATIKPSQPGHNLALSIDRRIQYVAYRALKKEVKEHDATSGSVVVLDARTGEVLAMADVPSFNPNDRPKIQDGRFRNRAVTDVTEPGSTSKAFSVSYALGSGKFTPNTAVDTSPGWWVVDGNTVRDDSDYGLLDVTGVLQQSSNVGISKITLSLPEAPLFDLLKAVGFGRVTQSGFPGESPGFLNPRVLQNQFTFATMAFGYGFDVTTLQLAQAYAILANGGVKIPVTLLKINKPPQGKRVISAKIAHEVLIMMESVVEPGGTATRAQVPGYRVSGKTGTVRMVGPDGYEANHHTGLFVGVAPVSDPQLVCAVVIKDAKKPSYYYFGGLVSAPVFAKVMGTALRELDITPDKPNPEQNNLVQQYLKPDATINNTTINTQNTPNSAGGGTANANETQ